MNSASDEVKANLAPHNIRVISCEIVKTTRFSDPHSVAAHIVVDSRDKDKAFNADV